MMREKALGMDLVPACGLDATEFSGLQSSVATLRGNLIKVTQSRS